MAHANHRISDRELVIGSFVYLNKTLKFDLWKAIMYDKGKIAYEGAIFFVNNGSVVASLMRSTLSLQHSYQRG